MSEGVRRESQTNDARRGASEAAHSLTNDALMGLRGIAALWVVSYHLRGTLADIFPIGWLAPLNNSFLGVELFFLLSGYSLSMVYSRKIGTLAAYGSFLRNRLARVYPLHVTMLLALVALSFVLARLDVELNHAQAYMIDYHLALQLLLMHGWGFEQHQTWNAPSWTISALFFCYLLFPALDRIARQVRGTPQLVAGIAASLAVMAVVLAALGHTSLHVPAHHALIRAVGEFFAGCLLYRLVAQAPRFAGAWPSLLAVGLMLLSLSPWADWNMSWGFALLVFLIATHDGFIPRVLASRAAVWLGTLSFSIYLVHHPMVGALRRIVPASTRAELDPISGLALVLAFFVAAVAVAALAHRVIEEPARRLLRTRSPG